MESSIKFGRVWGIEIGAHTSWLLVFALVTWSLAAGVFPERFPEWTSAEHWIVGVITSLLFFASVLFHELSHARVALNFGMRVRRIVLFIFGGMAQIAREAPSPWAEFWIAIVGPISSLALAGVFYVLARLVGQAMPLISGPARYLANINLLLGLFNLVPGFPLDGGRVLRSIVWGATGNFKTATRLATWAGQLVAYGLILWGVTTVFRGGGLLNGIWLGFIGWFLLNAASTSYAQVAIREALRGVPVTQVMTRDFEMVPPDLSVQGFVDDYLTQAPRQSFLVAENGQVEGVVTLNDVRKLPRDQRGRASLKDVMTGRDSLAVVNADDDVERVFTLMTEKEINQVPVVDHGDVVGVITRNQLLRFLDMRSALEA